MSVTVSIIMPVYNAARYLDKSINHIRNLRYEERLIDVFVVDNGSTDESVEILKKHRLTYCVDPELNISALRNLGVSRTKGEIVAFVDSDCYVDRHWLSVAVKVLMSDRSIGIIGSYYGIPENPTWVEKTWYDLKKDIAGEVLFLSSGNMLLRRSVFVKVGGFSEEVVTGEDYQLCQKVRQAGYKIVNNPKVKSIHMGNVKKLSDIIKKERWYGLGMLDTVRQGELSKPLLLSLSFVFLVLFFIVGGFLWWGVALLSFVLILMLPLVASYHLIKNVHSRRFHYFFKCIPLSVCYIIGRSLSIMDLFFMKIFNKRCP